MRSEAAEATLDSSRPVHATGPWAAWWRGWYRVLRLVEHPLLRFALRPGFGNLIVLRVTGRHTGRLRELPLGLLRVADGHYVGHPSGDCGWTLDLRGTTVATIEAADMPSRDVRATVLPPGPERDAVVRATFRQHPFPGNALYRLAARHVAATGVFFRLELASVPVDGARPPGPADHDRRPGEALHGAA